MTKLSKKQLKKLTQGNNKKPNKSTEGVHPTRCTECEHEWLLKPSDIKKEQLKFNDERVTHSYFMCPNCKVKFTVSLYDKECLAMIVERKRLTKSIAKAAKHYTETGNSFTLDKLQAQDKFLSEQIKAISTILKGALLDGKSIYK